MKEFINRIISFLIAFLLFSLNIFNTVSIFALDTLDDSDIVVINTIIDNKESLAEFKKMGLHNPLMILDEEEELNNNYSENSESNGDVTILNMSEEDSKPLTSDNGEVEVSLENSVENLENSFEEVIENQKEFEEDKIEISNENIIETEEVLKDEEVSSKENSSNESEEAIKIEEKEVVFDTSVEMLDELTSVELMSNDVSFLSDTIEIGGNIYDIADFHSMDEFLIAAYIISEDNRYDLIAGEAPSDMNVYLDFDVDLTLQFATSSNLLELNKFYVWEFAGITVGNPIDGQLVGSDGIIYGDYHISSDGKIYVVLNDEGVQQSVIKWNLEFSGLWNNTNGDSVTIDLGKGNIITIKLDKSKGEILKEGTDLGSFGHPNWERGKNIISYNVRINNYTNIEVQSIIDILEFAYGYEVFETYLEYKDKELEDILVIEDIRLEITDKQGTLTEYVIPNNEITIEYIKDEEKIKTEIIFEEPFNIPVDVFAELKYNVCIETDFFEYYHLEDLDSVQINNSIDIIMEDETFSDSDYFYFEEIDLIDKIVYLDNYKNGRGYVDWNLSMYSDEHIDYGGYLITDTLSEEIDYVFPYQGGSIIAYSTEEGYDDVYKRIPWIECNSQEEFDSLTEDNFPITDGSAIYWYGKSFKYLLPDLECSILYVMIEYATTYSEKLEQNDGKYVVNHSKVEKNGFIDETVVIDKPSTIKKGNTGIKSDEHGNLYTTWYIDWFVPADKPLSDFFFEDYTPFKENGDITYIDKLKLDTPDLYGSYILYSQEEARNLGIDFTIKTKNGEDITDTILNRLLFFDRTNNKNYEGGPSPNIYFSLADDNNADDFSYGGLSAYPEDLYIHLEFPMTLEGAKEDFKIHKNFCDWYTNGWAGPLRGESTLIVQSRNNYKYFRKNVINEELSPDGKELILTYEIRHNVMNYSEGKGFTYIDTLEDITYAKYVEDSLEVYWVDDINKDTENLSYYLYPFEDSEYAWESNLLNINENANYFLDSTQDESDNPIYVSVPMATIKEQSDFGFELEIPYYGITPNYCWYTEEWSRRYYSPIIRYKVALDVNKLNNEGIYRYNLGNESYAYLNTGELESLSNSVYEYKHTVLEKQMVQVPDNTNKYLAKYEVIVEAINPLLEGINRIHIIDEMTKDMNLLTDSVVVEYSDDKENWYALDEDLFRLLYDPGIHTMTCIIDNDVVQNYYRVSYSVRIIGISGQTVTISNNAHISGFKNLGDDISNDITIVQPEGNVDANVTEIIIHKYDANDLELKLQGAEFELYKMRTLTVEELESLNSLSSKEEVLDYINNQMLDPWVLLSNKTTDENGQIIWLNNEDGLLLPLNTLLKVREVSVPDGYFSNGENRYFFLSVDKGDSAERLAGKFITYFECRDHVANIFIANRKGSFTIQKVDGDNNKLLYAAEFGLYSDFECTDLIENSIDYDNGLYYFPALTLGETYYLKEIKAPANYKLDETVYTVIVGLDGVITISPDLETTVDGYIVFENYYDTIESDTIPNTGGNGYKYYRLIGLMLILGSFGAYIVILKNKKE